MVEARGRELAPGVIRHRIVSYHMASGFRKPLFLLPVFGGEGRDEWEAAVASASSALAA